MPAKQDTPYHYFVTFVTAGAFGNLAVDLRLPIRGMGDIQVIKKLLADDGVHDAVITGWQRFEQ